MRDQYLPAIDIGTGSARAVLFTRTGQQVGMGQREYGLREIRGVPGSQVFDTTTNRLLVGQCVREALASAGTGPDAVALRAWSLYDQDDNEIWACPTRTLAPSTRLLRLSPPAKGRRFMIVRGTG
jgi:sugar (pentulose or hexulose) kinase